MDISSLVKTQVQLAQLTQSAGSSSAAGGAASNLLAPATERVGKELESTNVKLSAYGQIKSSFGGAQTAAKGLTSSATSKTATNADIEKAAQAFVNAYNQAQQSVSSATSSSSKQTGALVADSRAKSAGNDLARSLTGGNGLSDLKKAGITQNSDGTLSLDTKALQTALQSNSTEAKAALANVGQQVSSATGRELASTGNVGVSVGKLTNRAQTLAAQQSVLEQQASSLQSLLDKQNNTLNYSIANSLAAYQKVLG